VNTLAEEGDRFAGALRAALQLADPAERYEALTEVQAACDALVSSIKLARGEALDEMLDGATQVEVADRVGLVRQKVQKLIIASRAAKATESTQTSAARAAQREEQQ
jgi:hypothetical protein